MFEISRFVADHQIDHARPQPRRRIQAPGPMAVERSSPTLTGRGIHLAGMRGSDDGGEKARRGHRLLARQLVYLKLEILGQ
jgi:hypothetical protein